MIYSCVSGQIVLNFHTAPYFGKIHNQKNEIPHFSGHLSSFSFKSKHLSSWMKREFSAFCEIRIDIPTCDRLTWRNYRVDWIQILRKHSLGFVVIPFRGFKRIHRVLLSFGASKVNFCAIFSIQNFCGSSKWLWVALNSFETTKRYHYES